MKPHEFIDAMHELDGVLKELHCKTELAMRILHGVLERTHRPVNTRMKYFISAMRDDMSVRLFYGLKCYDKNRYLEELSREEFMKMRTLGAKSYKEFLSLKEKYYNKIKERRNLKKLKS